jgi:hypothetical protein
MLKIVLSLFMAVGFCSAEIVNIDFTQANPWAAVDGLSSYVYQYSPGDTITLTALPTGNTLQQTGAGIGIGPYQGDEINGAEILNITFAPPVGLGSATVDKLYLTWLDQDEGEYQINGGAWTTFWGDSDGTVALDIGAQNVSSITFKAVKVGIFSPSDYAVKGLQLSVPDGGMTLMLLGGALAGLETLRRRFRA